MKVEDWLTLRDKDTLPVDIFNKKYKNEDESFDDFILRVSNNNPLVKELLLSRKFIFGGRILAGRGLHTKVSLSNCYMITPPEDNIESIFECATKLARTYSYGGGCGTHLSKLRPNGSKVSNASKVSSGPVSFMDLFSQVTQTISQQGRRGALMLSLDVRHPDIEEFIDCKTDLNRVKYANISVKVNNEFMQAVENDEDYLLRWPCDTTNNFGDWKSLPYNELTLVGENYIKRIKAKELFQKLAKNNWNYAEPGILYWDNISNYNMVNNDPEFEYAGVNPCAM